MVTQGIDVLAVSDLDLVINRKRRESGLPRRVRYRRPQKRDDPERSEGDDKPLKYP